MDWLSGKMLGCIVGDFAFCSDNQYYMWSMFTLRYDLQQLRTQPGHPLLGMRSLAMYRWPMSLKT